MKISVEVEIPGWLRKLTSVVGPASAIAVAGAVFATPTVKHWNTGDPLTATDLNNLSVLTVGSVKYSVGPTHFCGIGASTTTGAMAFNGKTGFAAAKAICEASSACGLSATAHMCDASEIVRSKQVGDTVPAGWYSSQTSALNNNLGGNFITNDCVDWSSAGNSNTGPFVAQILGAGPLTASFAACSGTANVLCCD